MKEQTRVIGFDDAPFSFGDQCVLVVGVLMRLRGYIEAVLSTSARVDGTDANEALEKCIMSSRYSEQPEAVMLDGASMGGFNVVDMEDLWKSTGIPVISVTRTPPDMGSMKDALEKHFVDWEHRLALLEKNRLFTVDTGHNAVSASAWGISEKRAKELIHSNTVMGALPECIRLAHLIASGIARGESRGSA